MDTSFNPDPGTKRIVSSIIVQSDGKVLFGGYSRLVSNNAVENVVRLNANGSLDRSFDPGAGPENQPLAVGLQPDGRMIIGGSFRMVAGRHLRGVARLNADGSLDGTFNPGSQVNDRVTSLVVQPDGKALIGGSFKTVHGFARPGIARLHTDGSLDSSFDPAIRFYATASHIRSVALQPDGRVLITGIFVTGNGNRGTTGRTSS